MASDAMQAKMDELAAEFKNMAAAAERNAEIQTLQQAMIKAKSGGPGGYDKLARRKSTCCGSLGIFHAWDISPVWI